MENHPDRSIVNDNMPYPNYERPRKRFKKRYVIIPIVAIFVLSGLTSDPDKLGSESFMPDFTNKSASESHSKLITLGVRSSSISLKDLEGETVYSPANLLVCSQSPEGGVEITESTDIELIVADSCEPEPPEKPGVVEKVEEAPKEVSTPDVNGATLYDARVRLKETIGAGVTITEKDATEPKRGVWDSSAWMVCSQNPVAGSTVAQNSKVDLIYARDSNECSTGQVTISEAQKKAVEQASKTTSAGLTESMAQSKCEEWAWITYGMKTDVHWIVDKRFADVVDEGYGDMWQFNVGITFPDDTEGLMVCKVSGTDDSPTLVDVGVNVLG